MAVGEKRLLERTQQIRMHQEAERKRIISSEYEFSIKNFFNKVWSADVKQAPSDSSLYF